ncbi:MAG: hypothetical protein PVH77_11470, partial [Phycisphaerales bacterium]
MSKPSFLTKFFDRGSLSVVLVLISLQMITISNLALSQENEGDDRGAAIRRIVQTYIQTGQDEYKKGFYDQSVKTFLMAQGWEEYLTAAMRRQLNEHLQKSQAAALKRRGALDTFRKVDELIKMDRLVEARASLEKIRDNEFLTKLERKQIAEVFRQIDAQLIEDKSRLEKAKRNELLARNESVQTVAKVNKLNLAEQKQAIAELYYRSLGFYRTGQLGKAREGFSKVVDSGLIPPAMRKTVEGYLVQIDQMLPTRAEQTFADKQDEPVVVAVTNPEFTEMEVIEPETMRLMSAEPGVNTPEIAPRIASPVTGQSSYIDVINSKRNIIRSHTKAVVNDAITKTHNYMNQEMFDKAKNAVETAILTVNKYQMHLGDELFKTYNDMLAALTEEISVRENQSAKQREHEKRKEAAKAQREYIEQMELDREQRIAELMENARSF